MFTHPDPIGQLAAEHHRHMLAEARQRALRQQHGRRSSRMPDVALRITRRLATAVAKGRRRGRRDPGRHLGEPARAGSAGRASEAWPSEHGR